MPRGRPKQFDFYVPTRVTSSTMVAIEDVAETHDVPIAEAVRILLNWGIRAQKRETASR